jgi:hypothetical protein
MVIEKIEDPIRGGTEKAQRFEPVQEVMLEMQNAAEP